MYQPIGTQRVKSRFDCVEITEYGIKKWPWAGKPTLKWMWGGTQTLFVFAFVFRA